MLIFPEKKSSETSKFKGKWNLLVSKGTNIEFFVCRLSLRQQSQQYVCVFHVSNWKLAVLLGSSRLSRITPLFRHALITCFRKLWVQQLWIHFNLVRATWSRIKSTNRSACFVEWESKNCMGAFHYAKDSGNFGRNSNGKVHFSFFWPEYSGSPLEVVHLFRLEYSVRNSPFHFWQTGFLP